MPDTEVANNVYIVGCGVRRKVLPSEGAVFIGEGTGPPIAIAALYSWALTAFACWAILCDALSGARAICSFRIPVL